MSDLEQAVASAAISDAYTVTPRRASLFQVSTPTHLLLAVLSGLSVQLLGGLMDSPYNLLLTGAVFGVLVLVPFLKSSGAWWLRALVLVAGAMLIHWGAVTLTIMVDESIQGRWDPWRELADYGTTGLLAALAAALLTRLAAPLPGDSRVLAYAVLAGALGGLVFAVTEHFDTLTWAAYPVWQVLIAAALRLAQAQGTDSPTRPVPMTGGASAASGV